MTFKYARCPSSHFDAILRGLYHPDDASGLPTEWKMEENEEYGLPLWAKACSNKRVTRLRL